VFWLVKSKEYASAAEPQPSGNKDLTINQNAKKFIVSTSYLDYGSHAAAGLKSKDGLRTPILPGNPGALR
jgi:hypothetical protein